MEFTRVFLVFGLLAMSYFGGGNALMGGGDGLRKCRFPAIYNFGDSNSDTGGRSDGKPVGRAGNGRLIIDFIAEKLGLPYLRAYLDSNGTRLQHGGNFAVGGASIRPGGYSPYHLDIQISQFMRYKSRLSDLYNKPAEGHFSKALYTMDIGQNDLAHGFQYSSVEQVRESIPDILNQFSKAVHQLYNAGARYFWVHNTAPIGCLPYNVIYYPLKPRNLDRNGCVEPQDKVAREFNRQLKTRITRFSAELKNVAFTYVDVYSAKYALISNAKNQGFVDPMKFCCGSYYGYHIDCGKTAVVNGTVYGKPCSDPSRHISWDGIHYSQAANLWVAKRILNGALSDPPVMIVESCHSIKNG